MSLVDCERVKRVDKLELKKHYLCCDGGPPLSFFPFFFASFVGNSSNKISLEKREIQINTEKIERTIGTINYSIIHIN